MKIKALVSIISVALVGLVAIQLYWIKQVDQNNKKLFDSTVQSSLTSIQKKLETREALYFTEKKVNIETDHLDYDEQDKNVKSFVPTQYQQRFKKTIEEKRLRGTAVLGVTIRNLDLDFAKKKGFESVYGVYVSYVFQDTPAFYAGLQTGDIITELDGISVNSVFELTEVLNNIKTGEEINLTFERPNEAKDAWQPRCKTIEKFDYDISNDSIRLNYKISIHDCENHEYLSSYEVIIDSTNKKNEVIITDNSKNNQGILVTHLVGIDSVLNTENQYKLNDLKSNSTDPEYVNFTSTAPLDRFKTYMEDDTIPNELKVENVMKVLLENETPNFADLYQFAVNTATKKMAARERKIEDRLKNFNLDKIIKEELDLQGIKSAPEWAVINELRNPVLESARFDKENSTMPTYSTLLFPNDIDRKANYLTLKFPEKQATLSSIFCSSLFPLFAFLFIATIVYCFYYAINTMLRQKKLSELKTDFINNMTHELKTPVSTIKLASEMLLDAGVPTDSKDRYVKIIQDENQRLGNQIERVLQIAKIEKSKTKLSYEKLNVHELLEKVMKHSLFQIEQKNGELAHNFSSASPVIEADRVHLTNIFNNLIDNAIKYSPKMPAISVSTEDTEEGIVVSFKDNGIGMNKDVQTKIFDKFYRVPTGNVHDVKGFGLGLSYVKLMTEAHGGKIKVKSKPNQGSLFQLFFPRNAVDLDLA